MGSQSVAAGTGKRAVITAVGSLGDDDSEVPYGGPGLLLQMWEPEKGSLARNYRAWSQAKIGRSLRSR
jgi:hypothetical protein